MRTSPRLLTSLAVAGCLVTVLWLLSRSDAEDPGSSPGTAPPLAPLASEVVPRPAADVSSASDAPAAAASSEATEVGPSAAALSAFEADLARLPAAVLAGTPLWEVDERWVVRLDAAAFGAKRAHWVARHTKPARIQGESRALKAMGLLPAEFDYVGWMNQQMTEGVHQYFDDDDGVVYRVEPLPDGVAVSQPAREVVVLLQYRHFGLARQLDERDLGPSGDDRGLARMALLSGHAMATYVDLELGPGIFLSERGLLVLADTEEAADESEELGALPEFLRRLLLFPEFEGARYVYARRAAAPGSPQDALFARMPRSTQEILHPARDAADDPVRRVSAHLPAPWLETEGVEPEYEAVLGEFALGAWLELVGKRDDAEELVATWDGHRMWSILRDKKVLLVHVSVWDDEAAARRFEEAVVALFAQRYGPEAKRRAAVARRGAQVAWLEGALPSKGKAGTALERLLDGVVLE